MPDHPNAGSTASSRRSSARSPTTRCPRRIARSCTCPLRATSSRSATTRLPARSASHYLAAHANAAEGAEADALAGQARIAFKAAASRAASLGAFDQAVTFLEQALTVTSDPAERADLLELAADASRGAGRYDERRAAVEDAVEARRKLGNRSAIAQAIADLGYVLGPSSGSDESLALLEPALEEFADLEDDPAVSAIKLNLARVV